MKDFDESCTGMVTIVEYYGLTSTILTEAERVREERVEKKTATEPRMELVKGTVSLAHISEAAVSEPGPMVGFSA